MKRTNLLWIIVVGACGALASSAPVVLAETSEHDHAHDHDHEAHAADEHAEDQTTPGAELRWQREPSMTCTTSNTPVLLSSAGVVRTVGLEFAQVRITPLVRTVDRNAELAYNANRYARLSSRASGVVADVVKDLGEHAAQGEVLAVVDSTDLGAAKSDLLQAVEMAKLWAANATRERDLLEKGIGIEREALEAETRAAESRIGVNRARQRLRNLGLSEDDIAMVERDFDTSSLLPIVAPFGGTVVERTAVVGEIVEPRHALVAIADTETMWAMVDLAESDIGVVHVGQRATVTLDGLPDRLFTGRVTWISTRVDPRTRTLSARVELDNADGVLRANMFGRARITSGDDREALTVPKEAVQWEGCCNVAFVRTDGAGTAFRPARLHLGYDAGNRYEVLRGLSPGDVVVTRGSFILKNEILKDAIGAGCCEVDHLDK